MAPISMRSNYSDLFGPSMLPVLEEIFRSELEMHPSRRDLLFKTVSTDRDIYQMTGIHDMPLFQQIAEGQDYSYFRPNQGASKTLTVVKYGSGFSISQEQVDDGKFDFMADATRKMAKAARESQEISAMNIFNNGFSTVTSSDGLSIFNTAHTLPSGLTFRNRLSTDADLSPASLEQALVDWETQFIGDSGIIYNLPVKILLVHPENKRYAKEIIGSDLKADSADNNMNSLKDDGLIVVSSPHLTDTDAWFLLASPEQTGLRIVQREGIKTMANESAGYHNDSIFYKAKYREVIGVGEAYGIFGSQGA